MKSQGIVKVIKSHAEGDMNVDWLLLLGATMLLHKGQK